MSVRANLPTKDAEVKLFLPEVQALENKKAGQPAIIPVGKSLKPQATWSRSFSKGQTFSRQETISVKQPGYYHVLLRVQAGNGEKVTKGGMPIVNSSWNDVWVWISPQEGKITEKFNSALFPKNIRPQPGLLTKMSERPQLQYDLEVHTNSSGSVTLQVNYRDKSSNSVTYKALKDAYVKYYLSSSGIVHHTGTKQTDDQGIVTIPCLSGENSYTVKIFNKNDDTKVFDGSHGSNSTTFAVETTGSLGSDCGETLVINSQNSYLFATMNKVISNSRSFFQESRGRISVYRNSGNSSFYNHDDYISILDKNNGENHIGDPYGNFGLAHEYGHALHEKGLGGIPNHSCPDPHSYYGSNNLGCAYTEGFADYHAAVTSTNSVPYFPTENFVLNGSDPNGSIVEGAVAAFLYDLTDPANEPFDNADYPGSYVAEVIKSCKANGNRANGIDNLIACFQHAVPDYSNYFPTRGNSPSSYSESATEPSGWAEIDIKKLWHEDLYGDTPPPPAPCTPSNLTLTNLYGINEHPHLEWDCFGGNADYYRLYRDNLSSPSIPWTRIASPNVSTYTDNEVIIKSHGPTRFLYKVTAVKSSSGESPSAILTDPSFPFYGTEQ